MTTMTKARLGGYIGATIGVLGWLIGLSIACLATGHTGLLLRVFPAGLVLSLGMAAVLIIVLEDAIRRFGAAHPLFQVSLWGLLLTDMGILILLVNHWIAPIIDSTPALAEALQRQGSVYRTPDFVPTLLMGFGAALLLVIMAAVLRDSVRHEAGEQED